MEDWKSKTNKMQEELTKVQAEYREMERKAGNIKLIMAQKSFISLFTFFSFVCRLRRAEK